MTFLCLALRRGKWVRNLISLLCFRLFFVVISVLVRLLLIMQVPLYSLLSPYCLPLQISQKLAKVRGNRFNMTTSTESNKIKNEDEVTNTATLQEDEEVIDVDHAPESMLEEGKLSGMEMHNRAAKTQLSYVSQKYDVDGDGKLDKTEQVMRDMDTDNLGHLSNEKIYKVMVEQMKLQQEVFSLKRMAMVLVMVVALLSVATLGTSFAAAILAKDTNVVDGNLVEKTDGTSVATRSRGSHVVATVDAEYVDRRLRMVIGLDTADDRRFLQQEGGVIAATASKKEVVDAYTNFERDGTQISVSISLYGMMHTELVAGSGLTFSEEAEGETWYRGLHAQDIPEPTYKVHCFRDAEKSCDVYQIGDIGAFRKIE
jgi:hypothetical protein